MGVAMICVISIRYHMRELTVARYYDLHTDLRFIALDLSEQLRPGTFEHALSHLIDHQIDLSHFDARYGNDETGAPAYPPAMLLKVVLFAYSQGLIGSRPIARACARDATFIALSGDHQPHFTTIAQFVSHLGDDIATVFGAVLAICQQQGLIGGALFAIDGVKLPSQASKHKSGTRAEFERQASKLEALAKHLLKQHETLDGEAVETDLSAQRVRKIERLKRDAEQLRDWLAAHPKDRLGASGNPIKSNRTDNESAKMATDKGVIQGYTGVAAADTKHQIIVAAQAHGTGSEQALLMPMVEAVAPLRTDDTLITADSGFHSEDNLVELDAQHINALIADKLMRQRDERFDEQAHHKAKPDPLYDKSAKPKKPPRYTPADFTYDPLAGTCVCPAGRSLYRHGSSLINGRPAVRFEGAKRVCGSCTQRERCLRTPDKTATRQVAFFGDKPITKGNRLVQQMKERIDSEEGRALYGQRFATVEPVFGNLRGNKRLNRFTYRGRDKVNGQWLLFCLVHNIEKLANQVYAQ
jgi:transposase